MTLTTGSVVNNRESHGKKSHKRFGHVRRILALETVSYSRLHLQDKAVYKKALPKRQEEEEIFSETENK